MHGSTTYQAWRSWLADPDRLPPEVAFTEGHGRDIAQAVWDSGVLGGGENTISRRPISRVRSLSIDLPAGDTIEVDMIGMNPRPSVLRLLVPGGCRVRTREVK